MNDQHEKAPEGVETEKADRFVKVEDICCYCGSDNGYVYLSPEGEVDEERSLSCRLGFDCYMCGGN